VCIALSTIVAHNIAQNRPDNFPSCPPDNHHGSDDVYLREGGHVHDTGFESATRRIIRHDSPEGVTAKSVLADCLVMAALRTRCGHYIFVPFLLHGVALVRI